MPQQYRCSKPGPQIALAQVLWTPGIHLQRRGMDNSDLWRRTVLLIHLPSPEVRFVDFGAVEDKLRIALL